MSQQETENEDLAVLEEPIYKLRKPFEFEDQQYSEFDLSCLDDLSRKDIDTALNIWSVSKGRRGDNFISDFNYYMIILSIAVKQPVEIFEKLGGRDYQQLSLRVMGFLNA